MEFRNAYRGPLRRAWLPLGFQGLDGAVRSLDLVVDTACSDAVVFRRSVFEELVWRPGDLKFTHWGVMLGGWLQLYVPACGLVELVLGYANDTIAAGVAEEDPNFMGLVGLPILRLGEYGGNADAFWFRYPPNSPTSTTP